MASYGQPIPAQSPELTEPLLHWRQVGSPFVAAIEAACAARTRDGELNQVDDGVAA